MNEIDVEALKNEIINEIDRDKDKAIDFLIYKFRGFLSGKLKSKFDESKNINEFLSKKIYDDECSFNDFLESCIANLTYRYYIQPAFEKLKINEKDEKYKNLMDLIINKQINKFTSEIKKLGIKTLAVRIADKKGEQW